MKFLSLFVTFVSFINSQILCENKELNNNCIQFSVSSGTGCDWMCNYCSNQLETNNYYFPDGVCSYQEGVGCVGNPISGKSYSCCSL